ncbi:hypothetical protein PCIT_b0146 [Pseudoalteromonas citrea]|uniref:Uncharacterized protein n=2 Tax=Pseudoalteromonas citrea TaxID=43655 RepID=A0AAD4AE04_9GAMM|nr:BMA_0021/BMA_0022 family TOMM bacteriocin [Pseudoalteromonas citrea]KAF7764210.1 hypothetical protein PCIT_b0146 [Pseudoalteromonas citrea]
MKNINHCFLSFRSAFVGAIAKSWHDHEYKKKFISTCKNTNNDILKFLEENPASENTSFISPWKNLSIQFRYKNLVWNPVDGRKWLGDNSGIILNIPKIPEKNDNSAEFLARYYNIFPTFYGLINHSPKKLISEEAINHNTPLIDYTESHLFDVDMISYTDESIRHFSAVIMEAIALYWRNEDFRNELTPESETNKINDGDIVNDKSPVLSKWLGFKNPWDMNILFNYDDSFELTESSLASNSIPSNVICLAYPESPSITSEDNTLLPMALANYNQDGSILPFSCS